MTIDWIADLVTWWTGLSPAAMFFFLVPFAVAAAGLLAGWRVRR